MTDPAPQNSPPKESTAATITGSIAWPLVVLIIFFTGVHYSGKIVGGLNGLAKNYKQLELKLSPTEAVLKVDARDVFKGLTSAISGHQDGQISTEQTAQAKKTAEFVTAEFTTIDAQHPEKRLRVLWVDDQPGNNVGLQYAFQALGIIVICVEDTDRVEQAFSTTDGFDVVITDMFRDAVRRKPDQPDAGLKTVDLVRGRFSQVPVIIYAGRYAVAHQGDELVDPVKAITNNPETVFALVTAMAKRKGL